MTGVTSYSYDAAGNQVTVVDPDSNTTTFVFNALGQETKETDPLDPSATFTYTGAGQLLSTTDRLGRRRDISYDALERQTGEVWVVSASTVNTKTFTYDAAGNQLTAADTNGAYTMAYDVLNRMTSQQQAFGQALTYTYDAAGNVTLRQDSQGGSLTSVYDSLNRLTNRQFGGPSLTTLRIDLTWTAADQLNSINRYSDLAGSTLVGSSTYGYDTAGRLTHIQHKDASSANIANYTYAYDAARRVTSEELNASYTTYSYDTTNQLTTVTNGSGNTTYGYDANGNRTNSGYQTGTNNQLTNDGTWTYTYDAEGNLSQKAKGSNAEVVTYTYNSVNELTEVQDWTSMGTTTVLYKYDVFGDRIEEDVTSFLGSTVSSRFGYDGQNVWADLDGSNSLQVRRFYLDGVDQVFARMTSGGTVGWYLTDLLGSVRDIESYLGASLVDHIDYDSYGNVTNETSSINGDRYKYTAREFDSATGLQYNHTRYYNSTIGRWISQDPLNVASGDSNFYQYAKNSPSCYLDSTGLIAKSDVWNWYQVLYLAEWQMEQNSPFPTSALVNAGSLAGSYNSGGVTVGISSTPIAIAQIDIVQTPIGPHSLPVANLYEVANAGIQADMQLAADMLAKAKNFIDSGPGGWRTHYGPAATGTTGNGYLSNGSYVRWDLTSAGIIRYTIPNPQNPTTQSPPSQLPGWNGNGNGNGAGPSSSDPGNHLRFPPAIPNPFRNPGSRPPYRLPPTVPPEESPFWRIPALPLFLVPMRPEWNQMLNPSPLVGPTPYPLYT